MNTFPNDAMTRAKWRKSSRSASGNDACVEVANIPAAVGVRDSKNPDGPKLAFDRETWRAFAARINAGDLDL